jgi:hypothetical protein
MFDDNDAFEKKPENRQIFQKGQEINDVVREICDLIPEENERLQHIKMQMLSDAAMLMVKVAGAEGGDLYDIRMESAAFIRRAAHDLMIQNHSLKAFGFEHVEYYSIVRRLIEEYRLLFIEWVEGFDKWNYVIDRWGLFNPPGVGPHDKDPDDDIPFNPDEFLE